jgi:hypothetical protein
MLNYFPKYLHLNREIIARIDGLVLVWYVRTSLLVVWIRTTSGKTGFHSEHLSQIKFDPRLKGLSVPVHLKMWARGH